MLTISTHKTLVLVVCFFLLSALYFESHSQAVDFGGRVVFTLPCVPPGPPGIWYVVVKPGPPPIVYPLINYPPFSTRQWFFPPYPSAVVLGKALPTPVPCMIIPPTPFTPPVFLFGFPVLYNGIAVGI